MPAEFIDILKMEELDIGHSNKHTADQQFYCVQGQCTFHFADAPSRALNPGMLVTIPAGQLYQLDNTGSEYMILLGARAEPAGNPRFSVAGSEVGHGDFAKRNFDKITAPEQKKAKARLEA